MRNPNVPPLALLDGRESFRHEHALRARLARLRADGFVDRYEPPVEDRETRSRMQGLVAMVGVVIATLVLVSIGFAIGAMWQADDRAERAEWGVEAPR